MKTYRTFGPWSVHNPHAAPRAVDVHWFLNYTIVHVEASSYDASFEEQFVIVPCIRAFEMNQ